MAGHKIRLEWIARGLCGDCGELRGDKGTKTRCEKHARLHAQKQAERNVRDRALREAQHQCLDCDEVLADPKAKRCFEHDIKYKQKHKDYYSKLTTK